MKGFFITFEGIEGSGKTTQINLLAQSLRDAGYPVVITREPGEGAIGCEIRQILLSTETTRLEPFAELFLLAADRCQHVHEMILPYLEEGKVVISDRYADSSVAYQSFGRGIPLESVELINELATSGLKPDLTYILDLDTVVSISRSFTRLKQQEMFNSEGRFESEHIGFHQRVRDGYLEIATVEPDRIVLLDGTMEVSTLADQIRRICLNRMDSNSSSGVR